MSYRTPGFRVLLRMRIHPGLEQGFEKEWHTVAEAVTGHPANLGHWLMRDSGADEPVYYIGSDWVDEQQFRQFEASPQHLAHRARLHPYRSDGSIATMRVLDHMPGAAADLG
ncbi:antibiotic biosynthesis monooxygenase family protein [Plantactinospora endophytica]|uniref:Antibiotic biosynthesis monooxygenase n=1 Tax=Plantactinospora endophytica TaxID=673535 RepID=A0ABQ4EBI0_9ACTN|nr:antibiotic biosynthesis monooxygenase family protein [Plantactinospora endophytica]GIG92064.1 antibiotic biosynthesis monooxygenase [Plantactinospora endophytica]